MTEDLTPEQEHARDEVHDLVQQHANLVGPDEGKSVFLEHWVLMACWVDADGESFLSRITSRNMPLHARDGLLHQGLYGFER